MAYQQPTLPWAENALEPHISAKTLSFHYGKHHAAYVTNYNNLVGGTPMDNMSIEEVIASTAGDSSKAGIFNNGAQAWNHSFYWNSLSPAGGGIPTGELGDAITRDFGSFDKFCDELKNAAATQFGSGWDMAGSGGRKSEGSENRKCSNPDDQRTEADSDHRCMGTRILSRLPEPQA